jgi:hypothetical protein
MSEDAEIREKLEQADLPSYVKGRLLAYIMDGESVGHFLTSVLSNNLKDAVGHADDNNLICLPQYVRFLFNYAPAPCWGSPEAVTAWIEQGGLNKTRRKNAGDEAKLEKDPQVAV